MSGGSFDYMFTHVKPLSEYPLKKMAETLEGLEFAGAAAAATRRCLNLLTEAETLAETLTDPWRAVEWWYSSDWGLDQMREEVERYAPPDGRQAEDVLYRLVDVGDKVFELRPVTLRQKEDASVQSVEPINIPRIQLPVDAFSKIQSPLRPLLLRVLEILREELREPGHCAGRSEVLLMNGIRRAFEETPA